MTALDGSAAREPGQYRPAGVVTRLLAVVVDTLVVIAAVFAINLGIVAVLFAWSPARFSWPDNWLAWTGVLFWWLAVLYLTVAWATIGRTYGAQLLGLRVLSDNRGLLGWPRAVLRALLCVVFPIGLLWAVVSRRRRSVQDILVRSIVVYDWHQDGGLRASASADAAPDRLTP